MNQCVHVPEGGQVHEGRALTLGDSRDVGIFHGGPGLLAGVVDRGQGVDPGVRDASHPQAGLGASARSGGRGPGQELEQRALADRSESNDACLHCGRL